MIARSLAAALLHFVWQGALVGLLLWTTLLAMRRRSANQRYAVSCAALALLAMLPAITAAVLCLQAGPSSASTPPVSATPRVVGLAESAVAAAAVAVGLRPVSWFDLLQLWTLPVWSAGVLLFSMRLAGA
jgi:hypothetical protein